MDIDVKRIIEDVNAIIDVKIDAVNSSDTEVTHVDHVIQVLYQIKNRLEAYFNA